MRREIKNLRYVFIRHVVKLRSRQLRIGKAETRVLRFTIVCASKPPHTVRRGRGFLVHSGTPRKLLNQYLSVLLLFFVQVHIQVDVLRHSVMLKR